jgi:1-phosphofructokinase family hexose kinase
VILCVGPNPAIDRSILVPDFAPFVVNRSTFSMEAAGGKAINVARAVQVLGGSTRCAGFLGGESGRRIERMVQDERMESAWTWIEGETRTCIIVAEPNSGRATVINDNGPTVTREDWVRFHVDVLNAANGVDCICLSGSLPPGSPPEAYVKLLHELGTLDIPIWVDTSGTTLRSVLDIPNIGIKINHEEIGAILERTISTPEDAFEAAEVLRERGVSTVMVTLGAPGAVAVSETGRWWAQPPSIHPVSGVGSGDSFLAGLVVALHRDATIGEALRWAVAAGTANALSIGGAKFEMAEFERILGETTLVSQN